MTKIFAIVVAMCLSSGITAKADFDRHAVAGQQYSAAAQQVLRIAHVKHIHRHYKHERETTPRRYRVMGANSARGSASTSSIVANPVGCPVVAFCGCGVALKVFGHHVRDLWLAANWLRFPRAHAAPGMVAVREHHVFYIVKVLSPGRVLAYDPNSGGHLTRIHERPLAGYSVRNPHAYASAS